MSLTGRSPSLNGLTSVRRNLVGWWFVDDIGAVGSVVVDYSGWRNNGRLDTGTNPPIIRGGFYPSQRHSGPGTAFQWVGGSGANEKCINVGTGTGLSPWGGQLSLLAWVYPTAVNDVDMLITKRDSSINYEAYVDSGVVHLIAANDVNSSVALVANRWQHVAITCNSSAPLTSFYTNGKPTGSSSATMGSFDDGSSVRIAGFGPATSNTFQGAMCDVRIYNRVLSAAEILAIYTEPFASSALTRPAIDMAWPPQAVTSLQLMGQIWM